MSLANLFWLCLGTGCLAYVVSAYCARLAQSRDRAAVLLDDPSISADERTEGVVEALRTRGGL